MKGTEGIPFGKQTVFHTLHRFRALLLTLSIIVVFVTTYLLILPALTLEKDTAKEQGGIGVDSETFQENTEALSYEGKGFDVDLTCTEKAQISADTKLTAKEFDQESREYQNYYAQTLKALQESESGQNVSELSFAHFYDISLNVDGSEVEPSDKVHVTISYDKGMPAEDSDHIKIVHFVEDEKTGEITPQVLDQENTDFTVRKKKMNEASFDTESFSVFGVVYTVDFEYDVNGKKFEYSLSGGGYVSLSRLFEAFDINANADDVGKVEFSNPDLAWVGRADKETTVGKLKEANGLKAQYSADLTEKQIKEIDAQKVPAGDWALISLKPFVSEETLSITMKNGDTFVVKVTDDQDALGLDGKTYTITYNDYAMLGVHSHPRWGDGEDAQRDQLDSGDASNEMAKWTIEYVNNTGYYLKTADGQYIKFNNGRDVVLTSNKSEATPLQIQKNPDNTYTISTNNENELQYKSNNNGQWGDPYFAGSDAKDPVSSGNLTFTEHVSHSDWLLYTDENKEITIHVGDTITLRPYGEWEWKDGDIQEKHWNIPLPSQENWTINASDENGSRLLEWTNGNFSFRRFVKLDGELNTRYWSVQGTALETGDYVLHSTTGNTITVHVVEGPSDKVPAVIAKTANIKVNLFDYDRDKVLDPSDDSNHANSPALNESINYDNKPFKFLSSGGGNTSGHYGSQWTMEQFDLNDYTGDRAHTGLVQSTLPADGYPKLTSQYDSNQSSLKYLFDTNQTTWTENGGMICYPDVNGLFQKDSNGFYYYNSNVNYAYYDTTTGDLKLYEHTYTQVSKSNGEVNTKPIGFFPFHQYNSSEDLWVNQNQNLNHHLGLSMDIDFYIPADRKDERDQDIVFDFSGDDDLWVFVEWVDDDGNKQSKLLLDLGGIHQPVTGRINFTDNSTGLQADHAYTLKVFYLERGGCDSNCSIRFNLPIVKDLTVAKKLNGLTPAERQKYFEDTFLYELALRHDAADLPIDVSDEDEIWEHEDQWRDQFSLYNTKDNQNTDPNKNYTVYHSKDGDILGYPVKDGHISLKNDESFTIENLPPTNIFYLAEENQLDMNQFEKPHAERLYLDGNNNEHEEEVHLHQGTAASDGQSDWETKPYALLDTERLVYTNTLQEKNLDVEKIWADGNENHESHPIKFKLKATVLDGSENGKDYAEFMSEYNQSHGTQYSTNINAQWTQRVSTGAVTTTENVLNKDYTLNTANSWKVWFEHLPKKTQDPDGKGNEIVYSIEEVDDTIPDGYTSTVGDIADADKVYLDIFKFWPDNNRNHRGEKAETFTVRIKDADGNYVRFVKDTNGEWQYTDKEGEGVTDITFGSDSSNEMFDYAARLNNLPRYKSDESTEIKYTFEQINDTDTTTTGLVMFQRPVEEIKIRNTPNPVDITIKKVDKDSTSKLLPGAVFRLFHVDENGIDEPFENEAFSLEGEGEDAKKTGPFTITNGEITLSNIAPGRYHLKEISPPPGYVIANADTYFTVQVGGGIIITDQAGEVIQNPDETMAQVGDDGALLVKNEAGVELPYTGGSGNVWLYLLGALLIVLSGAGLILKKRREAA